MVRRQRLSPGEAMPWHRDPFHRVAVVLGGDLLSIEYRDGGESHQAEVTSGQVDWEEPSARVHRALTSAKRLTSKLLSSCSTPPDAVPQPQLFELPPIWVAP
jgi:hypothetical protein